MSTACAPQASTSQARAHAKALDVALRDGVASKADIDRLETKLSGDINRLEAKIETATAHLKVETFKLGLF